MSKTSLVIVGETPSFRTIGNHWSNYCSVRSDFCVSCNCSWLQEFNKRKVASIASCNSYFYFCGV
jgi:hypothetical protein